MSIHRRATGAVTVTGPDGRIVANLSRETLVKPSAPQVMVDSETAEAIRSLLHTGLLSEEPPRMPDEVWARIEVALEEEAGHPVLGECLDEDWASVAYLEDKLLNR